MQKPASYKLANPSTIPDASFSMILELHDDVIKLSPIFSCSQNVIHPTALSDCFIDQMTKQYFFLCSV
jgi:hypothetical protein